MSDTRPTVDALREDILLHSVRTGDFVLKSGQRSGWFIDAKQTLCRPSGMLIAATAVLDVLMDMPALPDAIGGLTMGADPVAFITAGVAAVRGIGLKVFSVRKEAKDHGSGGTIAGALDAHDKVVVVEDVATRGASLLQAIKAVSAVGAVPVLALAIVDRGGVAGELVGSAGVPFRALLSAPELGFEYGG
ncbi:MAG: orotate phosphoribosyltransferase [Actinobacteria bacterium]|nr:orotate phosphoribosyltransferase [Actinomycetota bacterium]